MPPDVLAHPVGHLYPDHINCQFTRQKYAPQAIMGRGTSRGLTNKQSLRDDLNIMSSESFSQHRQPQVPFSLSFEKEKLSKASETGDYDYEYVLQRSCISFSNTLLDLLPQRTRMHRMSLYHERLPLTRPPSLPRRQVLNSLSPLSAVVHLTMIFHQRMPNFRNMVSRNKLILLHYLLVGSRLQVLEPGMKKRFDWSFLGMEAWKVSNLFDPVSYLPANEHHT
jgi:hypothetical protein